jgi:hypothetical protein
LGAPGALGAVAGPGVCRGETALDAVSDACPAWAFLIALDIRVGIETGSNSYYIGELIQYLDTALLTSQTPRARLCVAQTETGHFALPKIDRADSEGTPSAGASNRKRRAGV